MADQIVSKLCRACEKQKPLDEFYRCKGRIPHYCKRCTIKGLKCSPARRTELRFWSFVDITEGCWLWHGKPHHSGYGNFSYNGTTMGAHQFAYERFVGPRKGLHVLHKCDVKTCIRPDHLFLGTNTDNVKDKVEKDRQPKGEQVSIAKLTAPQVIEIRSLSKTGHGQRALGRRFGVNHSTIANILNGITWRHV